MKRYIGTKLIAAVAMTRAAYNDFRGWKLPDDEIGTDEGYLVEYLDGGKPNVPSHTGYVSWSPKEQFDAAYRPCHEMTFGLAMEAMKRGDTVARTGWNGKGMFVYLVPANSYPAQTGAAKSHFGADAMVPYNAYMALKGADDTVSTWAPSSSDAMAEDWAIVEVAAGRPTLYADLEPHQQRMMHERTKLGADIDKLAAFIDSDQGKALPEDEQQRQAEQVAAMRTYYRVLNLRIHAFQQVQHQPV